MSAGAASSESFTVAGGFTSKLAPSHGCWQEASVLHHMDIFIGCLSLLMTWQLASHRVNDLKERAAKAPVPLNRILEVTCYPFCHILLIT